MQRFFKLSLATLGAVAATAALGGGATAAPPGGLGPEWVTYPAPAGLNEALTVRHVVQGTLDLPTLGCSFSIGGDVSAGSAGAQWDEVAFNPARCQAIYLVGPAQTAVPDDASTTASDARGGGATAAPALRTLARHASFTKAAYLRTWYEDPATIDVSVLRNDSEWTSNGSCNTSYKWKRNASWFTASGWYLDYVGDSPLFNCDYARSDSHAKMENDIFCWAAFNDPENVWTVYNYDHKVSGHPDGGYAWAYDDYVNSTLSICYRLLSHHASTNYETPW